jgi:hypothetical protein
MNFDHPPGTTKGQAAEKLYSGQTYDCAIPQSFVNACHERGFDDITGHFVTLYPKGETFGYIAPITARGVEIAARIATHSA